MSLAAALDHHHVVTSGRCALAQVPGAAAAMAQLAKAINSLTKRLQRRWVLGPYSSSAGPILAFIWLLFWMYSYPESNTSSGIAGLPDAHYEHHGLVSSLRSYAATPVAELLIALQSAAASATLQTAFLATTAAWVAIELAFYLFWFRPVYKQWNVRCNAHQSPAAQGTAECYALFKRFMHFTRSAPCQLEFLYAYLSTWFRGATPEDIKRENMEELFAYGFFYRTREQLDVLGLGHLPREMVSDFEDCFNFKFPPGYNPDLQFMSHLWEDLRVSWRPLAFYAVMESLAALAAVAMWAMGFKRQQYGALHYYTRSISQDRIESSNTKQQQQQPVVFIHGVAGLLLYLPLLARFATLQVPLLVLDMKHVGLRISGSIPTVDALATSLAAALQHHHLPPALVVAHSYGTLVAGRLLRLQRAAVASVLFVDPVCFGMFMPRLLHGFIYATLNIDWSRPLAAAFNVLLWLVSKDIHLAATFARNFYWSDLNLWPEDLPEGSCVVLSGADALVSSEEIGIMLCSSPHVKVMCKPGLIHGGFMLDHTTRNEVITAVQTLTSAILSAATTTDDAAAAGVTPSAADVAAVVMDAEVLPKADQTLAPVPACSRSPFGPTLDKADQADQIDQPFSGHHSQHLPAVSELTASRSNSSSCSSCGRDLVVLDQDIQGFEDQCEQGRPTVARRHTYDLVANSMTGSSMFGDISNGNRSIGKDVAAAAAATVVATAASNGAAAAALLLAAARPAGLSPYCAHCCHQCCRQPQFTPAPVVQRRYTVR